ncbi:MAG: outer membrane lipoprotein carrier protein LolA [Pseudomonadota bacterium]
MGISTFAAVSAICVDAIAFTPATAVAAPQAAPLAVLGVAAAQDAASPELRPAPDVTPAPGAPEDSNEAAAVEDEDAFDGPLAFEGEEDETVVARLKTYLEGVDTLQGAFTQVAPSGAISTGKFYLRRPGFLRFEYDPPTPLLIVANSGVVYVRDEALETTDSYPVGKTPLKFLLSKKVELDDAKVVAVDRGVDTVAVTFASDGEENEGELTLISSAPNMTLRRWIVRDAQNGVTVVTLDNVVAGERLANRLFRAPDAGGQFLKN